MVTLDKQNIAEWALRSRKGEVCGMAGCAARPSSQCPRCGNHYCYEHVRVHFHAAISKADEK